MVLRIQRFPDNYPHSLFDWVGTRVEYTDIRPVDITFASGSYKGTNQSFGLKLKNFGSVTVSTVHARVKIEALNYSNYHIWVEKEFSYSISTLEPNETSNSLYRYLPYVFQGYNESSFETWRGWYAMNIGAYEITQIFLNSTKGTCTTTFSDEIFGVTSYTHKVFVPALVYDGNSVDSVIDSFDDLEVNEMYVNTSTGWSSTSFSTYFSTDFLPILTFESNDSTSNVKFDTTWNNWLRNEARILLGLEGNWSNEIGTSAENHGFDLLFGTIDDLGSVGVASSNMFSVDDDHISGSRVYLHEILHTYMHNATVETPYSNVEHLEYYPIYNATYNGTHWVNWVWNDTYQIHNYFGGYIMGGDPTWYLHLDTEERVTDYINEYDGYDG